MSLVHLPKLIGLLINSDDSFTSCPGTETPHPPEFQQIPNSRKPLGISSSSAADGGAMSEGAEC